MTRTPRWKVLIAILILDLAVTTGISLTEAVNMQSRFMLLISIQVLTLLLILIWLLFLSRLPLKVRLIGFSGLIIMAVGCSQLFVVREVTGDVLPILEWRWRSEEALPSATENAAIPDEDLKLSFPQFLGPNRNGHCDTHIKSWKGALPELVWKQPIGEGWSGFAIAGPLAFTMEQRGEEEVVTCYDLQTGTLFWSTVNQAHYGNTIGGTGPRATPTIYGGRIYTHGAMGLLQCLDLQGQVIWRRQLLTDDAVIEWGTSCSPLIFDNQVIVSVGGEGRALCAFSLIDGSDLWCSGDDGASYSSPTAFDLAQRTQIVILQSSSVAGYDPHGGGVLWQFPWSDQQPNVSQPMRINDHQILVSSGYGVGSALLDIQSSGDQLTVTETWRSPRMKAKFTHLVKVDDYVYGLDDGTLTCISLADGERVWRGKRYGHGQILLLGEYILVLSERGALAQVTASPDKYEEIGSFQALEGKTWNTMAYADGLVLVRNSHEAACFRLP
ncbi:MAG: PQQ-like beta-propeller repeat protein [Acidobacteria bacterium]|nr:PQQ-like beta-propeller repeat protein [Acidobacteriota bacterium]